MDDSTTTDATTPAEPASGEGQAPATTSKTEPPAKSAPQVFDADYVKQLRKEAADNRKAREAAESRLRELDERDKTDAEKLATRASENEARAVEAEAKALRYEVAHAHGLDMSAAAFLTGSTREEIDARATELAKLLKANNQPAPAPTFDGGARKTPEATTTPEAAHNDTLLRVLGRVPEQ